MGAIARYRFGTTTTPTEVPADRFRRLDAFLQKLQADIYPQPPSPVHTDLSRRMFAELVRHHPQAPDASFDLVWRRRAIEHSVFPFFTLAELHRVLKPLGVLYLEVPAPDTSCRHQTNPNHYGVPGKSMWLELIRRVGFPQTRVLDLNFQTGAGPDTDWAFIQQKPG